LRRGGTPNFRNQGGRRGEAKKIPNRLAHDCNEKGNHHGEKRLRFTLKLPGEGGTDPSIHPLCGENGGRRKSLDGKLNAKKQPISVKVNEKRLRKIGGGGKLT